MRIASLVPLVALAGGVSAQPESDFIEPQDFDVRSALKDLGVNVSSLPEPELSARSLLAPCSLAVSANNHKIITYSEG
jgi:hypothetical protein